jgi:chromosome segregation ATPase
VPSEPRSLRTGTIPVAVKSEEIVGEVELLEQKLAALRARMEEEESTFGELEGHVRELGGKLTRTQREVASFEALVAKKQAQLAEAEYEDALEAREHAAARLAESASQVLVELEAYDGAQLALAALRGNTDAGDARDEVEILAEPWARLVEILVELEAYDQAQGAGAGVLDRTDGQDGREVPAQPWDRLVEACRERIAGQLQPGSSAQRRGDRSF